METERATGLPRVRTVRVTTERMLRRPRSGNRQQIPPTRQAKLKRKCHCPARALAGRLVDFRCGSCDKREQECCSRSPRTRPETSPVANSLPLGRGYRKAGGRGGGSSSPPCLP